MKPLHALVLTKQSSAALERERKAVDEFFGAREWDTIKGINVWLRKP